MGGYSLKGVMVVVYSVCVWRCVCVERERAIEHRLGGCRGQYVLPGTLTGGSKMWDWTSVQRAVWASSPKGAQACGGGLACWRRQKADCTARRMQVRAGACSGELCGTAPGPMCLPLQVSHCTLWP